MLPVLMFASGLVAGVVGVRLLKKATPPAAPDLRQLGQRTRDGLRDATLSGLGAIESQAAALRAKLTPEVTATPDETTDPAAAPALEPVAAPAQEPVAAPAQEPVAAPAQEPAAEAKAAAPTDPAP